MQQNNINTKAPHKLKFKTKGYNISAKEIKKLELKRKINWQNKPTNNKNNNNSNKNKTKEMLS